MDKYQQLSQLLAQFEAEMRELGFWQSATPDKHALQSKEPFSVDTLSFQEWTQWVMIPRFNYLIEQRQPLPSGSNIQPMAETSFQEHSCDTQALLALYTELDKLLNPLH